MNKNLGFYKLIKDFLSDEHCKEILSLLPKQDDTIPYINEESKTKIGSWHRNQITDQRCTLNIDNDILEKIKIYLPGTHNYVAERMYITKYDVGQQCTPHTDPVDITIIILLSDEFEGGELFVKNRRVNLRKGDAIIFSDKETHFVSKITKGTRNALSVWLKIQQR